MTLDLSLQRLAVGSGELIALVAVTSFIIETTIIILELFFLSPSATSAFENNTMVDLPQATIVLATLLTSFWLQSFPNCVQGFAIPERTIYHGRSRHFKLFVGNDDRYGDSAWSSHMQALTKRLESLRVRILEETLRRPPNPSLTPDEFVSAILNALLHPYDPIPDAGFRLLLRSSTDAWRNKIYESIGAPKDADLELVASSLGAAIARPHNQFAILVGEEEELQEFSVWFPSDPLDFFDGTCWVECHLRDKKDHSLLVIMGWQLVQRPSDGSWMVDGIDWQDFRDAYRPGIGREEWERICG